MTSPPPPNTPSNATPLPPPPHPAWRRYGAGAVAAMQRLPWGSPAVLAALLFLAGVLINSTTNRYEYRECDMDGCIVLDRWTPRVTYRLAEMKRAEIRREHGAAALNRVERIATGRAP